MRKLASIQRVLSVDSIEGADFISKLRVLGWTLVSQKGNFNAGDLCVYFEVDSILPNTPQFDFMLGGLSPEDRLLEDKVKKALRLRIKKMKKIASQGLALPLSLFTGILPEGIAEGTDVTELLGVIKYDPPEDSMSKEAEGPFPYQVHKTDETRVQAVPDVLVELNGKECYISVKMDGQSLTFAKIVEDDVGTTVNKVCTRNQALKPIEGSPHWKMANDLDIFSKLPANFAIQGEFCGPKIQGNKMNLKEHHFYAFQIFNISEDKYLDFEEFIATCKEWGVETVPIEAASFTINHAVDEMIELSGGKYASGFPREGIVIRTLKEQHSHALGGRASFKVINPDFLLKEK